ncbi:MAG TPA: UDP-N-acetylmuramoyl-tripeptide--D-alanyl-D-alanine ligase [Gemmatimonadota bacterium]
MNAFRRVVLRNAALLRLALARRRLRDTAVVAVTGSVGKTTTKDLLAAIVASQGSVTRTLGSWNGPGNLAQALLSTPRGTRACILEMAARGPGSLDLSLRIARPRIGVVTHVLSDHAPAFRTLEATAREKGKLPAALPRHGVAVLNADDPRVLSMRERCVARVLTYGCAETAELRAVEVSGDWPERLAFTVVHGGRTLDVRTEMVGRHWVHVVLAALGGAIALGVPLDDAVAAVQGARPAFGRLMPHEIGGVTFLRDDFKGAESSYGPALEQLRTARAPRKVAVIGTVRHVVEPVSEPYGRIAREASAAADRVFFVGPNAEAALRGVDLAALSNVAVAPTIDAARDLLRDVLRPGDFVLLKGHYGEDHLARLALDRAEPVSCWRRVCARKGLCDTCELLRAPWHGEEDGGLRGRTRVRVPETAP